MAGERTWNSGAWEGSQVGDQCRDSDEVSWFPQGDITESSRCPAVGIIEDVLQSTPSSGWKSGCSISNGIESMN